MELEQADLACLLVSEVVTNVVLHAAPSPSPRPEFVLEPAGSRGLGVVGVGGWDVAPFGEALPGPPGSEFTLRLRRGHESVWVEVFDADLRLPRIRSAGESDEGGRGLYLVDQLATRWGSRPTKDGKAVWFELPIKGTGGANSGGPGAGPRYWGFRGWPPGLNRYCWATQATSMTSTKPTMTVIHSLPLEPRPIRRRVRVRNRAHRIPRNISRISPGSTHASQGQASPPEHKPPGG